MTLLRKSNFPFFKNEKWMTDFFENDRFFDADWMKPFAVPTLPAVNILEEDKEFIIELAAPGMNKKDFHVEVENGILTISVEKELEKEEENKNYARKEYSFNQFLRSFTLPENVSDEKIKAHYENGILKLQIAKKELTNVPLRKEIAVV
jgi:HSP20 family protein